MRFFYIYLLLFIVTRLSAQELKQAQRFADSTEYLIYEDMDLKQAQLLNLKATQLFKKLNHPTGLMHCKINEAIIWAQKDSFSQCLQLLHVIEEQYSSLIDSNSRLIGLFLTSKAWALWGIAQYQDAYEVALKACPILEQHEDWDRFVNASLLATYAIYYNNNSDFSTIDQHMDSTYLTAIQYLPPSRLIFKYIYQLYGAILYQQGRIDQAIHITKQGLNYEYQLLRQNHLKKDSSIVAQYYSNLGRMYAENNDIEQSINYYNNAFIFYRHLNNYSALIKLCTRIGELYTKKEKDAEADLYFGKIPSYISFVSNDPIIQLRENNFNHLSIAYYYQHFNLHDSTLIYYHENIAAIQKHNLAIDKAYLNMGAAYEALGDYKQAGYYYSKALVITQQKYGYKGTKIASIYFNLGHLAAEEHKYKKAIAYMDTVIFFLDESPKSKGDKIQLLEYLLDKSIAIKAYQKRGDAFVQKGQLDKAYADFNSIILLTNYLRDHYTDSESKLLSSNRLRPIYEKAASAAWHLFQTQQEESYTVSIFDYAEHSKSTLLNEHILKFRNNYKHGGIGIPQKLLQQEEKYIALIDQCKEHILEAKKEQDKAKEANYLNKILLLEQQLDSLEESLQANFPSYRSWDHGRDSIVSPKEVQNHLTDNELFIEYFISDNHFFIIYISSNEIKIKEVPNFNSTHFKAKIRNLRRSLSNVEFILEYEKEAFQTFCEESHWFYHHFLADDLLKDIEHLIIVPDRNLHYIPFEILLTELPKNTKDIDYQKLPYLIRQYSIHYEYSAAIMVNTQQKTNTLNGKILGFAASYGEQFRYQQLHSAQKKERTQDELNLHNNAAPIPGTIKELKELSYLFDGDFFTDKAANEHAFKQHLNESEYSIIHLAMHGIVDYDHPSYSALLFTENLDSLEDNLLYSYETQHLNGLHSNLVVLSACKTGYGKYAQGEGIISLGRSFLYAGIPSVVMTLWELNDQTSIQVMQTFYNNLAAGQSKNKAMQNAKIHYLNNNRGFTAHPFFWASMVSIGNQQPIPLAHRPYSWYWYLIIGALGLGLFMFLWKKYQTHA